MTYGTPDSNFQAVKLRDLSEKSWGWSLCGREQLVFGEKSKLVPEKRCGGLVVGTLRFCWWPFQRGTQ